MKNTFSGITQSVIDAVSSIISVDTLNEVKQRPHTALMAKLGKNTNKTDNTRSLMSNTKVGFTSTPKEPVREGKIDDLMQARKDRAEKAADEYEEPKTNKKTSKPATKVAGKAYGGAAQKASKDDDDDDDAPKKSKIDEWFKNQLIAQSQMYKIVKLVEHTLAESSSSEIGRARKLATDAIKSGVGAPIKQAQHRANEIHAAFSKHLKPGAVPHNVVDTHISKIMNKDFRTHRFAPRKVGDSGPPKVVFAAHKSMQVVNSEFKQKDSNLLPEGAMSNLHIDLTTLSDKEFHEIHKTTKKAMRDSLSGKTPMDRIKSTVKHSIKHVSDRTKIKV